METFSGSWETGWEGWKSANFVDSPQINWIESSTVRTQSDPKYFARSGSYYMMTESPRVLFYLLPDGARNSNISVSIWAAYFDNFSSSSVKLTTNIVGYTSANSNGVVVDSLQTTGGSAANTYYNFTHTLTVGTDYPQYAVAIQLDVNNRIGGRDDWEISWEPNTSTFCKHNGVWKPSEKYVKHNGVWKPAETKVKHNGVWKNV